MMKKQKTVSILLVVLVALGGLYYYLDRKDKAREAEELSEAEASTTAEDEDLTPIVSYEAEDLSAIEIKNDAGTLRFETVVENPAEEAKDAEANDDGDAKDANAPAAAADSDAATGKDADKESESETEAEATTEAPESTTTQAPPQVQWKLVEPEIQKGTTQDSIDAIPRKILKITVVRNVGDVEDAELSEYGLDKPQAQAVYRETSGTETTLLLGDKLSKGDQYYAKLEDSPRVVILGPVGTNLLSEATDLLPVTLSDGTVEQWRRFTFQRAEDDLTITAQLELNANVNEDARDQAEEGLKDEKTLLDPQLRGFYHWEIQEPFVWEGDESKLTEFLTSFAELKVNRWLAIAPDDDTLKSYGLDAPRYQMDYELTDDLHNSLSFGKDLGSGEAVAYSAQHDAIFSYPVNSLRHVSMSVVDFFNRFSYIENINTIGEIKLKYGDTEHTLTIFNPTPEEKEAAPEGEKPEPDYKIDGKDANVVDESKQGYFNGLYRSLISVMMEGLNLEAEPKLDPVFTMSFKNRFTDEVHQVDLVERDDETFYVFLDKNYTGFYCLQDELYLAEGSEDLGILPTLDLLLEAVDGAENNVYARPTEAADAADSAAKD